MDRGVVDAQVSKSWSVETIPDDDRIYVRMHRSRCKDDPYYIAPSCFEEKPHQGCGMSSEWSQYATPGQTRSREGREKAELNAVVSLQVGDLRSLPDDAAQRVEHDPLPGNRAHTLVHGRKTERIRKLIKRYARIEIRYTDPVTG